MPLMCMQSGVMPAVLAYQHASSNCTRAPAGGGCATQPNPTERNSQTCLPAGLTGCATHLPVMAHRPLPGQAKSFVSSTPHASQGTCHSSDPQRHCTP